MNIPKRNGVKPLSRVMTLGYIVCVVFIKLLQYVAIWVWILPLWGTNPAPLFVKRREETGELNPMKQICFPEWHVVPRFRKEGFYGCEMGSNSSDFGICPVDAPLFI
jgi:hypothetical protein